jgi:nucleoside-diphosphate-sugar epimerase
VRGIDSFTDAYDPAEKRERVASLVPEAGFSLVPEDLAEAALDSTIAGAEVVFHLAGRAGVRASFGTEDKYIHDNVEATERLLEACTRTASVRRLVFASSSSVYGDGPRPFREDGAVAPISPYARTKLTAEEMCLNASRSNLETVALRYFTVYGPGQRPDMALRLFAEAALSGRPLQLLGDGTQSRDFTFVEDVVRATRLAADAPVSGLAINIGGGAVISLLAVFDLLRALIGPIQIETHPSARGDVNHTEADHTRARTILGFEAEVSIADGYSRQVDYLRSRVHGDDSPHP